MESIQSQTTLPPDPTKVFVIHGRNIDARDAMFDFLKSAGLKPIEWDAAVARAVEATPFIGDVLTQAFEDAQAVIALFTGDDVARLGNRFEHETATPQARPNVIFEAGMAFGRLPRRTILVKLGEMRMPSDMAGLLFVDMTNGIEQRKALLQRLQSAGCRVDTGAGEDWKGRGDFESCVREPDKLTSKRTRTAALLVALLSLIVIGGIFYPSIAKRLREPAPIRFAGVVKPPHPGIMIAIVSTWTVTDTSGSYSVAIPRTPQGTYTGVVYDYFTNQTAFQNVPNGNVDLTKGEGTFNYELPQQ